jgi:NitT/TauT family transport system substrate-binding protein
VRQSEVRKSPEEVAVPHEKSNRKYSLLVGLLALLGIHSCFCDAAAADNIRIGVPDVSGQFVTYPLAQSRGFLKQEGLDAEIVVIRGNVAMAAVVSGDVDYTVGIPQGVRGALLGIPLKVVACFEPSSALMLLAGPRVKSLADLTGKTIAVGSVGGTPTRLARLLLKQANVNPDKNINYLSAGAASARLALMKQGTADAAMVPSPFDVEGKKFGYTVLAKSYELLSLPQSGLAIHANRLKEKPDEIRRVIRAGIKANQYMRSNREGSIKFLMEWQRAGADVATSTYDAAWRLYNNDGAMPIDGLNLLIQDTKEMLDLKREVAIQDLADLSILTIAQGELGIKGK